MKRKVLGYVWSWSDHELRVVSGGPYGARLEAVGPRGGPLLNADLDHHGARRLGQLLIDAADRAERAPDHA